MGEKRFKDIVNDLKELFIFFILLILLLGVFISVGYKVGSSVYDDYLNIVTTEQVCQQQEIEMMFVDGTKGVELATICNTITRDETINDKVTFWTLFLILVFFSTMVIITLPRCNRY